MTLVQGRAVQRNILQLNHGGAVGAKLTAFKMKTFGLIGPVEFVEFPRFSRGP